MRIEHIGRIERIEHIERIAHTGTPRVAAAGVSHSFSQPFNVHLTESAGIHSACGIRNIRGIRDIRDIRGTRHPRNLPLRHSTHSSQAVRPCALRVPRVPRALPAVFWCSVLPILTTERLDNGSVRVRSSPLHHTNPNGLVPSV